MSTEINATMAMGGWGNEGIPEDYEELGMVYLAPHYDAGLEECFCGFAVEDILYEDISPLWATHLKELAESFKQITGRDAQLVGAANVF